ncbi:MAG: hypothetical protein KC731_01105 [Myxococcales bacterium]|nr:hypothetical protein [Myxococcales bacterium]
MPRFWIGSGPLFGGLLAGGLLAGGLLGGGLLGCAPREAAPASAPAADVTPTGGDAAGAVAEPPLTEESKPKDEETPDDDDGGADEPEPKPGLTPSTRPARPTPVEVGPSPKSSTRATALDAFEEEELKLAKLLDLGADALSSEGGCDRVCGSLESLRRAADALCDLAGKEDARCTDARGRLKRSESRVKGAGCGC